MIAQVNASDRFLLWIDAVGGYWVCLADEVTLGQPSAGGGVDVPILGDLSSRQARIRRDAEGYLIEALREVRVSGSVVQGAAPLGDGCLVELGRHVRLVFRLPHALSATARLDFASPHRTQPSSDAILLMADSCVLGPGAHSHVVCRDWPQEIVLYRRGRELFCRTAGPIEIDGRAARDRGPLTWHSRVSGEGFSFSLEAIGH